jgi:hypothetical protein
VPYSVSFDSSRGVVLLTYTGPLDLDLVEESAVLTTATAVEQACGRVLADTRAITSPLSPTELVGVARGLGHLGLEPGQKVAILASRLVSAHAVFEVVAEGAGYEVRVFSEEADAVGWLTSEDGNSRKTDIPG